jgi:multidrug resistance efflux pump
VDMHSFRVDGYFEETKLGGIDIGQPVDIKVMGEAGILRGHVQSIVAAIEDRDRQQSATLLPNVNPAFSWVRLAQRIPVRVQLDEIPADFRMIAGRTATVSVRGVGPSLGLRPASGTVPASPTAPTAPVPAHASATSTASGVPAASAAGASQ